MLIKNNCLIISKNKEINKENILLLYCLSMFEHRLCNCNLTLILNEQFSSNFRSRLINSILYLTQCMEYYNNGKIEVFTSDKQLIVDFLNKKNDHGNSFNKLLIYELKDLVKLDYLNDDLSLKTDNRFSEINKIQDNTISVYVPDISEIPTIRI